MSSAARSQANNKWRLGWILAGILAVLLVVLVAALTRPDTSTTAHPTGSPSPESSEAAPAVPDLARRIASDPAALGAIDAPVVLIEYADYRCPFCGVYSRETLPVLVKEYVNEGLLRIEWRDTPIFGDESVAAAVATRAAGQQGLFWEYSAAVFAYETRDHQSLPRERLVQIASVVGVPDLTAFETALDDPEMLALVSRDSQEASAIGVRSTPTFLVGQTPIMGAQPLEAFRQAIESELARVGR